MSYKIGLVLDEPKIEMSTDESRSADEQKRITANKIYEVLSKKYEVVNIVADVKIIENLKNSNIDIVFNLSTGVRGESRQSQIPAILEMLGIPYVGSGILAHAMALDKTVAKQIFKYHDVLTPNFQIFHDENEKLNPELKFPLIIKPACEGSGFGIHGDSVVYEEEAVRKKVSKLLKQYQPPILAEEFIEGREFTVGIIGNGKDKTVLPILEIDFKDIPEEYGKFYSFEVKANFGHKTNYYCPAPISNKLEEQIKAMASKAFDALGCRDLARVDVRVRDDVPYILEINSLPGLKPVYSDLTKMAEAAGISYDELIIKILEEAIKRIGKVRRVNS
ncbi:D-alanine--D-alanine ligase family protein [Lutispora thermophila]|uniref:D-alanine-D-alanine ligase n=1 Tax=Lutispora thermophila DSM 19022 TaxID=1122184 RepID=A0A1M6ASY7_9FIRM|nr:ATP-grasp domain-containing protein [Lutispora thermophila]SHI39624.1 D-alanine-D-alanine ligase [Lutispora thermophila DSM 19022]